MGLALFVNRSATASPLQLQPEGTRVSDNKLALWGRWLWANIWSWTVAMPISLLAVAILFQGDYTSVGSTVAYWAVIGAITGFAQASVLRSHISLPGWWIVVSSIGGAIGYWVSGLGMLATEWRLVGLILGTTTGIAQWVMLQRHVERAWWWLLASGVGWGVAWISAFLLFPSTDAPHPVTFIVQGASIGTIGGALTGTAIAWLCGRPRQKLV